MEQLNNQEEIQKKNSEEAQKLAAEAPTEKKKVSLADFKVKSFVTNVKVEQMQFLKTAGG